VIPITVHVPDHRVEDFYIRFGEFIADTGDRDSPTRLDSGMVPSWVLEDEADAIAARLWSALSGQGQILLHKLIINAKQTTVRVTPEELAAAFGHPKGTARVAGVLGGVGKAIRRAGLPLYKTPSGDVWHYVWDWDGEHYSMTPEVAAVLGRARNREGRTQ
jgi:hypothetical protein